MPNETNIERPLIIIGAGRAGTSWLQVVLKHHPEVQRVIDNTLLGSIYRDVFDSWWSPAFLKMVCAEDEAKRDEVVIAAIRSLICQVFPGEESNWATKAIWDWTKESFGGVPNEFRRKLFPEARYLHFARDPRTAMPSIVEYFQDRGQLDTIWKAEEAYNDAHDDAFRMRDAGVHYLLVKQEEIREDPTRAWEQIEKFAGFPASALPEELLRSEINQSKSQVGNVRRGRNPLDWSELRLRTHEVARKLGYEVPPGAEAKRETDAGEEWARTADAGQNRVERLASENYQLAAELRTLKEKVAELTEVIERG